MNKLEVGRVERLVALIINGIVYGMFIGGIVNWYLYATQGKTVGSIIMKFKTLNTDGTVPGLGGSIKFFFIRIVWGFLVGITFGIFFIYDMLTLEKRNGNFKEVWSGQYKNEGE